jgi:hypothetical protein
MTGKGIVLTGVITDIFPAEIYGGFEKRVVWVKQTDRYPEHWALEMWQGDGNVLDKFKIGQEVICVVDIKGRQNNKSGKSFVINTLRCTKIDKK